MNCELEILPFAPRHLDEAARIEALCFSVPWSRAMLREEIENPRACYLAAEEGGVLAGYAGLHAVLDEGYVTNVAVAPGFRRRGVASRLMAGLRAQAERRALSFLTLEVRVSNHAAVALYEKYGFRPVGQRPGYYEKPKEDALIMTLNLMRNS